jgi:hypothetical protein
VAWQVTTTETVTQHRDALLLLLASVEIVI